MNGPIAVLVVVCLALSCGAAFAADGAAPNLDASRVTLDVKDAPLSKVIEMLVEQSGNKLRAGTSIPDRRVTFSGARLPYWQAFDGICAAAGVYYQTWGLTEAEKFQRIGAYTGPVMVRVEQAVRKRYFHNFPVVAADPGPPRHDYLSYSLAAFCESRLPVGWMHVKITGVSTPDGRSLDLSQEKLIGPDRSTPPRETLIVDRSSPACYAHLSLADVAEGAGKLAKIEGVVSVGLASGEKEVRVDDISSAKEHRFAGDGFALVASNLRRERESLRLNLTVVTTVPVALSHDEARWGLLLVDPKGKRYSLSTPGHFARPAPSAARLAELGITAAPGVVGEEQHFDAGFYDKVPQMDGKWSMVFVYPQEYEKREFPFTIKDVPLP